MKKCQSHIEMQTRMVPFSMTQIKKFGNIRSIGKTGRKRAFMLNSWESKLVPSFECGLANLSE